MHTAINPEAGIGSDLGSFYDTVPGALAFELERNPVGTDPAPVKIGGTALDICAVAVGEQPAKLPPYSTGSIDGDI